MDIKDIENLTPEQIKAVIAYMTTNTQQKYKKNHKLISVRRNDLYFNSTPKPHMCDSFETYNQHADSIREQVISGVDLQ